MKRKISIALLIALMTTILSFNVLAAEVVEENMYDTMLISEDLEMDYISNFEDYYDTMPITNDTIKVQLDGEYLDFTDENGNVVNPEIINDRTMVPMRKIFETFDAEVMWDAATRTVVAKTTEKEITLTIDSDKAKVKNIETEEEKVITLDAVPLILNDRTMVPVRFIAESLEKEVGWDADYRTVIIIDFDKLAKQLEEKAPVLKDIFELEVESFESFKTESEITGEINYKDSEDKKNNESVEIKGELELNMNKEKEIEMVFDLEFDGNGNIFDSIKEVGVEKLKYAIIIADDSAYVMMEQNGEEIWMDASSEFDFSSLETLQLTNTPKSYAEYMEIIKASLGELDITTYNLVEQMINIYGAIYNEENLTISGTGSKKTLKLEVGIMEFVEALFSEIPEANLGLENINANLSVVEKLSDKKVDSAKITFELNVEEPTTKEAMEMNFELDMKYKDINKDFDIKLPTITVE